MAKGEKDTRGDKNQRDQGQHFLLERKKRSDNKYSTTEPMTESLTKILDNEELDNNEQSMTESLIDTLDNKELGMLHLERFLIDNRSP